MTPDRILAGVQEALLQYVSPVVTNPDIQKQVQGMAGQLSALAASWNTEDARQRAANATLLGLLDRAAALFANGEQAAVGNDARAAVAALPAEDGTMLSVYHRQEALLGALVPVIETLETAAAHGADDTALALRADIYTALIAHYAVAQPRRPGQPAPASA